MKAIRVQYTVHENFVEQNEANIAAVMAELRETGNTDIHYAAYKMDDGKTFMHFVQYNTDDTSLPSSLPAFLHFQKELKENVEVPPDAKNFDLVDISYEIF